MVQTSGFALEVCITSSGDACWASLPLVLNKTQDRWRVQRFSLHCRMKNAAMQYSLKHSSLAQAKIKCPAVKIGIRRKNHLAAQRRDSGFNLQ